MDTTNDQVNAISLFAGYGGLETGVRAAIPSLRIRAYVEREAHAVALLAQKIKAGVLDEAPIWSDVTTFPAEKFRGKIHLVIAGYPCQDFSCAGKREGLEGDRGKMWGFTRSVLNGCDAPAFIGENVLGHLSLGFDTVVSDLAEDGFHVEGGIQSAAAVGLPHLRKRIFSFAIKTDVREWGIREPDDLIRVIRKSNRGYELRDSSSQRLEGASGQELQGGSDGLAGADGTGMVGEQAGEPRQEGDGEGRGEVGSNGDGAGFRGDPSGDVPDSTSSRQGGEHRLGGGGDSGGISQYEGQVGSDLRGDAGSSGGSDGGGELVNPMRGGHGERTLGQMGEETAEERERWHQLAQEAGYSSAGDLGVEIDTCLALAGLFDEGYPGTVFNGGEPCLDFGDVGNSKHNGSSTKSKLRGGEGSGTVGPKEEPKQAIEPTGADRPVDVSSVSGCEGGSEQLGDPEHDGSPATEGGGGSGEEQEEGRVQESEGGCELFPVRAVARPGESQYDWEAPRVTEASAQPELGGEPDDVTQGLHLNQIRQDRLRLCGNGVVWLSAGRAVSEIYVKHKKWLTKLDESAEKEGDGEKSKK